MHKAWRIPWNVYFSNMAGVRDETVNLEENTTAGKEESSVNSDSEKVSLASENLETADQLPENPGAENVTEVAANSDWL